MDTVCSQAVNEYQGPRRQSREALLDASGLVVAAGNLA